MKLLGARTSEGSLRQSRWIQIVLLLLILCALCRPYWGRTEIPFVSRGENIIVALDISRSMLINDVTPSRIEQAQRKILDIIKYASRNSPTSRIGIILFAGSAYLYCPPTSDFTVLKTYTNSISSSYIEDQGTNLAEAVIEAKSALAGKEGKIILLTDGEDEEYNQSQLQGLIGDKSTPVFSIGFGTERGAPVPTGRGSYFKDENGQTVISKLDSDALEEIAEISGGRYVQASLNSDDITQFFSGGGEAIEQKVLQKNEFGFVFLITAGLLLIYALWRHRLIVTCLICLLSADETFADTQTDAYVGSTQYKEQKFKEAQKHFEEAYKGDPNNPDTLQALGSSQFKSGDLDAAKDSFKNLDAIAPTDEQKFVARYNLGNSQLAQKNYKDAISSYDSALSLNPQDQRALTNKKIAEELLKEQQQQNQQNENEQQNNQNQQQENEKNQQQQTPEEKPQQDPDQRQQNNQQPQEQKDQDEQKQKSSQPEDKQEKSDQSMEHPKREMKKDSKEAESAKQWLDSLPESPVLLRKKNGKHTSQGRQAW